MSDKILKLKSSEVSLTSANSVYLNPIVRVLNPTASPVVLTFQVAAGTPYANCTIAASNDKIVVKAPTDLLLGAGLLGVAVAYSD